MNRSLPTLILFGAVLAVTPVAAQQAPKQAPSSGRLTMTSGRLYQAAKSTYEDMAETLQAHRALLTQARDSGLVVAVDAIQKDYAASRELLSFGRELVGDLRRDLALDRPDASGDVPIEDVRAYPQVRELGILADQMAQLLQSGEKFMALLNKPTETAVERIDPEDDGGLTP